jgi:hypothetical protein
MWDALGSDRVSRLAARTGKEHIRALAGTHLIRGGRIVY